MSDRPGPQDSADEFTPDAKASRSVDLRYAWRALSVVSIAGTLTSLNVSTLNIALPYVVRHFDVTAALAPWIVIVFGLTSTCVMLTFGRMADRVARRPMYLTGIGLFTAASLALGFSPNVGVLLGLQSVQAIAEAMLLANSAVIVTTVFPARMHGRGLGIYMAGFSVASLLGPSLGGALASSLGWRWVYWFNVPLGVVLLVWGALVLRPMPATRAPTSLDLRGNVLLVLGLGGFITALSMGSTAGWTSTVVLGGAALALVFLPLFVWAERRARDPLLDIRVFRRTPLTLAIVAGLVNSTSSAGVVVLLALYLQTVKGYDALGAGWAVLPLAAAQVLGSVAVGSLTYRLAPSRVAALGAGLAVVGLVLLLVATSTLQAGVLITAGLVLKGFGSGIFTPANAAATLHDTSPTELGRINAVRLTVQNVAWTAGAALALTLLTAPLPDALQHAVFAASGAGLDPAALAQLADGYRLAFAMTTLFAVAAAVISLLRGGVGSRGRRSTNSGP